MDQFKEKAETAAKATAQECLNLVMQHNVKLTESDGFDQLSLKHTLHFLLITENEISKLFYAKVMEIKKILESEEK